MEVIKTPAWGAGFRLLWDLFEIRDKATHRFHGSTLGNRCSSSGGVESSLGSAIYHMRNYPPHDGKDDTIDDLVFEVEHEFLRLES